jgi:nucleotide-binding universal stress UspA family protein
MAVSWEEHLEYETKRCKDMCQSYLLEFEEGFKQDGLNVRSEVLIGNPADAIIDYANNNNVNTIVMSTHGRTGLGRWAFGSIAEKILKGASCPIFLVRIKSTN